MRLPVPTKIGTIPEIELCMGTTQMPEAWFTILPDLPLPPISHYRLDFIYAFRQLFG